MFQIHNRLVFFAISAALIGYVLFMMLRKRKGERPGQPDREPEL